MKVLIVTDTIHAGGAETFVLRLAKKLNEMKLQAEILSLNPDIENKELTDQYLTLTIHRIQLPLLRWIKRGDRLLRLMDIDFSLQYYLIRKIISRKYLPNYNLFHTHLISVDYLFARIKLSHPQTHIVSTLHGDYNEFEVFWQNKSAHKKLAWPKKVGLLKQQINNWVYISKQQWELFANEYKVPADKLHKIYNGYETNDALAKKENGANATGASLTFIMVARGIEAKGWEYAIKAFQQLEVHHKLVLVGKGPFLSQLNDKYKEIPNIEFSGFHPRPVELINEADVFVFPSVYKTESLPTVIIEALYCGIPVISTDIGEVAEMLMDTDTGKRAGILIEKESEQVIVTGLIQAMKTYIGNRALLSQHSALARQAAQKFSMDACCHSYIGLYNRTLALNKSNTFTPFI